MYLRVCGVLASFREHNQVHPKSTVLGGKKKRLQNLASSLLPTNLSLPHSVDSISGSELTSYTQLQLQTSANALHVAKLLKGGKTSTGSGTEDVEVADKNGDCALPR